MRDRTPSLGPVLGLFFFSGAASLLYQVVWIRLFVHEFGATVLAVSTVLAAFMAGLALGGLAGGRWAGRFRNPLAVYGVLEIALALYAGLVPWILDALGPFYVSIYPRFEGNFAALSALRFGVSGLVLLPPTFLMGATLPLLTAHTERIETSRRRIALLYAINTFGAMFGTIAASFLLLPAVGCADTLLVGVIANIIVGLSAIALGRGLGRVSPALEPSPPVASGSELSPPPRILLILTTATLGFSALAFEVLWTRTLTLALGTTTYAFAIVLGVFLLGIATGSAAATRWLRTPETASRIFSYIPAAIGLLAIGCLPVFDRLPDLFVRLSAAGTGSWGQSLAVKFLLSALPLFPPTFLSGAAFPLAVGLDRARGGASRSVGDLYAFNTLGAILGSWAAGFLLLPTLGLRNGIAFAAILPVLISAALLTRRGGPGRVAAVAAVGIAAVLVGFLPDWNRAALTRGGFALGVELRRSGLTELKPDHSELLFLEEGITSTITVRRWRDELSMQMNGVTEATNTGDLVTQIMTGALPLLLHENPQDVLVIGLGSGITAAGAARHPGVKTVDCVEISEAVVHAARFFDEANGHLFDDPRFNMIVGDGRNHLRLSRRTYDVVVSQPSNVWNSGIGSLMSVEFYELCRDHLRPGGVLCSWIQGYSLSPDALRSVLAAARQKFAHVTLWMGGWGDLLIVAGDESFGFDIERILDKGKDPAIRSILRDIDCPDLVSLLSRNILAGDAVDRYVAGVTPNTDDNAYLEFQAPRLLYRETMPVLFRSLNAAAGGAEGLLRNAPEGLAPQLERARRARTLESEAHLVLREEKGVRGLETLEEAHRLHPTAPDIARFLAEGLVSRGSAMQRQGNLAEAVSEFLRAADLDPGADAPFVQLAKAYEAAGRFPRALEALDEALRRKPNSPETLAFRARLLSRTRSLDEATRDATRALAIDPWVYDAYLALGDVFRQRRDLARAESIYAAGIERFPDSEELARLFQKTAASPQGN